MERPRPAEGTLTHAPFHATRMGARFFESELPKLVAAVESLARSLQLIAGSATRQVGAAEQPGRIWLISKAGMPTVPAASARAASWLIARQIDEEYEGRVTPPAIAQTKDDVLMWGERETREPSGITMNVYGYRIESTPVVDYR